MKVPLKTPVRNVSSPDMESRLNESWSITYWLRENFLWIISIRTEVTAMIPRPPSWIIIRITIFPKSDQWMYVSTTTRPVTHMDVVAVKIAVSRLVFSPSAVETGSIRSSVPTAIAIKKLSGII